MPSWPQNPKYLGKSSQRVDGPVKVTGAARYSSDIHNNGWLYGMILRSKWANAKIHSIDLSAALNSPGIKAAIKVREDEFIAHFYGQELAAVAGTNKQACLDALALIKVDATELPHVVDEKTAVNPDSVRVFPDFPNIGDPRVRENGEVDQAFAQATTIVEGHYTTQIQMHHCLETHGNTAHQQGDTLTVWASTQGVFSVRDGLAGNLEIPQNQVRVISDFMGGGFGSKFGPGVEGILASRLTRQTGLPVKLMLPRYDEAKAVGYRPSSFQQIRMGADADGKIIAFEMNAFGSAGYASGPSTAGGGGRAGFPAPYIYDIPNTRVRQAGVALNSGSARAFRAPGHPQASFGMESIMDEMALKLKMDPLDFRLKNDTHDSTPAEIRRKEWKLAAERFGWKKKYRSPRSSPGIIKTGIGLAGGTWGGGGRGTQAECQINADGSVELRCGTQDLGTGTRTLMAMIAAEIFGLEPGQVTARLGDTLFPPSGGSGGSTTAASVSPAIHNVCHNALKELREMSGVENPTGDNWREACRKIGIQPLIAQGRWVEGLSSRGVGGVQMAEVTVDTETGVVKIKKIVCVQDCGLVVNQLTCESQAYGGVIMGIGYALFEERIMDPLSVVVLNPNFETYKLPGAQDMPEIDITLLDMPERGVIGVGEPVTIPTAAAIANAVANALGVRIPSIPITPDKVLAALGEVPNKPAASLAGSWGNFHKKLHWDEIQPAQAPEEGH